MLRLGIILSSIGIIFCSCQDTKSKQNTNVTPISQKENLTTQHPEKKQKKHQRITNETAVTFLTEYGKNNTETLVKLETKFGEIEIELYEDTPLHRANFIHIIKRKFLDETCFYRVDKGFVIQGGNSDKFSMAKIKSRIGKFMIPSEMNPKHKHTYGAVAMARVYKGNPEKKSSPFEFYICMDPKGSPHLNGEHTVFGRVTKGMDVAKKINILKTDQSEWPIDDVYMTATVIK